jgi:hypothetical protein
MGLLARTAAPGHTRGGSEKPEGEQTGARQHVLQTTQRRRRQASAAAKHTTTVVAVNSWCRQHTTAR